MTDEPNCPKGQLSFSANPKLSILSPNVLTVPALDQPGVVAVPNSWHAAIAMWMQVLRAGARPASTLYLRDYQLRRLAADLAPLGPWDVRNEDLVAWSADKAWGRETRRSYRAAVRNFYRWAHGAGHVEVDPARELPIVRPQEPNPRPAPEDAYRLALAVADERVRLMLRLAAELGMRRGEVAQAHVRDLERDIFGWTIVVHGKGDKIRRVPITDSLAATIRRAPGYLFPGRIDGHLSAAHVGKLVRRSLPAGWAMHSLRHRFATAAYAVDRDMFAVQELLGHASPATTRRYVKVPNDSLRRTVQAVAAAS